MNARTHLLTVVATSLLLSQSARAEEPILIGRQVGGTYKVKETRIRFFAFTCKGLLDREDIQGVVSKVMSRMKKQGKTAEMLEFSRFNKNGLGQKLAHLKRGEIFVLGWSDKDGNKSAWIAIDTDGEIGTPTRRWISSSGGSGKIQFRADSPRSKREAEQFFQVGKTKASQVYLRILDRSGGYLVWWMGRRSDLRE